MDNRKKSRIQKNLYGERNRRACFHVAEKHSEAKETRRSFVGLTIRVLFVLFIFTVQQAYAMLTRNDIEEVQQMLVNPGERVEMVTNIHGPLSPLMIYLCDKRNDIHKLRFYSSYMYPNYIVSSKRYGNTYRRSPANDKARHKDLELGKMDHANFFNILMHMFPSPDGELSIDPARSINSFTKFLNSENIKKHAHTLLAMLLLRTEGIEVPLELNRSNKKFSTVTLRKVCIDDKENAQKTGCIHLNLYNLHCKKQNHTTNQLEYFNKVHILEEIINYITRTCTNLQVNAYRKAIEGDLKKEFWDKYFISSPNWLIQSY
ncbi:hypothetical protein NEAUS03_2406, partial [Nematocida ausubeli]